MKSGKSIAILLSFCICAGCGHPDEGRNDEPVVNERHVWSEQTDTLERAKAAEATVHDAAQRQRDALEAMED